MEPTLYPYQNFGRDFLASRKAAGLFDDPGLGKSGQTCCAWKVVGAKTVIVVCPASVTAVWKHEVIKWGAGDPLVVNSKVPPVIGKINICSYDYAMRHAAKLIALSADALVLDEAHFLKSHTAKRTKAIYGAKMDGKTGIAGSCNHVWVLTGTPMPNNPSELWTMMHCLFPDAIARRDGSPLPYWQFVNKFCQTYDNGFGLQIIGGKNLPELRERLMERCLRRKAEKVLKDLPSIRYAMLPVEGDLRGLDAAELVEVKAALEMSDPLEGLKKIGTHVASLRRFTGLAKVDSVIKWCQENIDNYGKIVVFAHHKDVMQKLAAGLPDCRVISGATSAKDREAAVHDFQHGDAKYFIGQIQAAGTGLTLTAANVLVFAEYSWVPAENQQASKRIHRIGQESSCLVYFATVEGSVDEDIMKAVRTKMEMIKGLGL